MQKNTDFFKIFEKNTNFKKIVILENSSILRFQKGAICKKTMH